MGAFLILRRFRAQDLQIFRFSKGATALDLCVEFPTELYPSLGAFLPASWLPLSPLPPYTFPPSPLNPFLPASLLSGIFSKNGLFRFRLKHSLKASDLVISFRPRETPCLTFIKFINFNVIRVAWVVDKKRPGIWAVSTPGSTPFPFPPSNPVNVILKCGERGTGVETDFEPKFYSSHNWKLPLLELKYPQLLKERRKEGKKERRKEGKKERRK